MENKILPIGIEDFDEIVKDYYYVDKTEFIKDLLNNWSEVNLFTRPRRFGKTLTISMLKNFFEIGTDKSLFDGLNISKETELCEKYMGQYPVVYISLREVDGKTFEDAYGILCSIICSEASRLRFLLDSPKIAEDEKISFRNILNKVQSKTEIK